MVAVTVVGMVVAEFSEALKPGRSAHSALPPEGGIGACVRLIKMESCCHV